ncbi:MAG: hypothetical protein N3B16_03000 [Candidatus Aminicenantes bacterium]|nr:hypothetical protein [Candidatus Aminicenantes bacterium]
MGRLWAGAANKEINPPPTLPLAGYIRRTGKPTGFHDPLELNICWLEDGATPLIFLTIDVLLFDQGFTEKIKGYLAEELGIPTASILPAATHTHSAPALHDFHGLNVRDSKWEEWVLNMAVATAKKARSQARRSSWSFKSGEIKLAQNRRLKDGPIDSFFPVVFLIDHKEDPVALLTGYGCHPVCLDENNLLISADYVGSFRDQIRRYLGLDLPILFFIGAAGETNPLERGSFEAARKLGQELMAFTASRLKEMSFSSEIKLSHLEKKVKFPLANPFSADEIQRLIFNWEQKMERAEHRPDWLDPAEKAQIQAFLLWAKALKEAFIAKNLPSTLTATLAGYRLNDLTILSHPFEIFASFGQKTREKINLRLWFVSCSHGYEGYLADEEETKKGGYEFEEAYRYFRLLPLAPQAEQVFLRATSQIFENL